MALTLTATVTKEVETIEQAIKEYKWFKEKVEDLDNIRVDGHISGDIETIILNDG